ncbi:MAG: hypothetical protein K0S55_1726 [Clostridia bacterium]|jgi:ABC-2 type transport system permease protein|nr:hypothetical protein [Clostridia bacterium]
MKQFFTILKFELKGYLKNKIYVGITLFIILICGVILSIPTITNLFKSVETEDPNQTTDNENIEKEKFLLINPTENDYLNIFIGAFPYYEIKQDNVDEADVEKEINAGNYKYAVVIETPLKYKLYTQTFTMYDTMSMQINSVMESAYKTSAMVTAGISPEDANVILTTAVQVEQIETGKSMMQNFFYTYILMFMLYMAILLYGQMVATSVATEKSSRAMELLITSAKPNNLMFGKVIGSGLSGLFQMTALLVSSFIFYRINIGAWGENDIIKSIFNMPVETMLYTILFFILGYFLYSFMYASLGSLANRTEDINTSVMPVTFLFIAAFFISFTGMMGDINSPLMIIASYVPFTSPMAMFVRVSMSTVPWWEITLSVFILIASTGLIGVFAAKIYRIGVLMYGKPPKIKELIKILKTTK